MSGVVTGEWVGEGAGGFTGTFYDATAEGQLVKISTESTTNLASTLALEGAFTAYEQLYRDNTQLLLDEIDVQTDDIKTVLLRHDNDVQTILTGIRRLGEQIQSIVSDIREDVSWLKNQYDARFNGHSSSGTAVPDNWYGNLYRRVEEIEADQTTFLATYANDRIYWSRWDVEWPNVWRRYQDVLISDYLTETLYKSQKTFTNVIRLPGINARMMDCFLYPIYSHLGKPYTENWCEFRFDIFEDNLRYDVSGPKSTVLDVQSSPDLWVCKSYMPGAYGKFNPVRPTDGIEYYSEHLKNVLARPYGYALWP